MEEVWIGQNVKIIFEGNKILGFHAVGRDITDRKKEENLRKVLQEKYQNIIANMNLGLLEVDNNEIIQYANQSFADISGYEISELFGKNILEIFSFSKNFDILKSKNQLRKQGKSDMYQIEIKNKRGEPRWWAISGAPNYDDKGNLLGTIGIHLDITDQKKTEEQIRTLVEFQNIILNGTDYSIITSSADGTITTFNKGAEKMLGYKAEEVIGRPSPILHDITEIETRAKLLTEELKIKVEPDIDVFHIKSRLGYKIDVYECTNICKDGSRISVELSISTLRNKENVVVGYLGIAKDISQSKIAQESIIKAKEAAEQANFLKEQFLANMSHEIRTPMNAIIGMADILQENNLSVEQKECVDAIKLSGDNLLAIINDILDFSKIESGKVAFENTPFKLEDIVVGIIQTLHFTSIKKSISLSYHISKDIPEIIIGDPLRLRQMLLNLASNSIKFTEKGSVKIDIQLKNKKEDRCTLLFNIIDTGIGIPDDKLLSIFESFTQSSNETTRKFGGTGLGLTITKQLVELQGGWISVNSEIGIGSCFSFTLTFGKGDLDDIQIKADETTIAYSELQNIRILLAEDNLMNQLLAKKIFKKWNCKFEIVDNGKIAVDNLLQTDYDIILMDIQMPEMDGYEATKYIRTNLPSPKSNIPIIAISAHAMVGEKGKCLALGMNDYISKPFNQQVLYEKIKELTVKK